MHKFSHPLSVSPSGDSIGFLVPVAGGGAGSFVDCSVVEKHPRVSPEDAAEIKNLHTALERSVQDALDAGCLAIQEALGVKDGGFAALFFSGSGKDGVKNALTEYLVAQADEVSSEDDFVSRDRG